MPVREIPATGWPRDHESARAEAAGKGSQAMRRKTKDARIADLRAALKWALWEGIEARFMPASPGGIGFRSGGCGCCSDIIEPPEELAGIVREVVAELRRERG